MTDNSTLETSDFRQMQSSQLAIAGVAIAVISMILEFIALSGFAPSVARDENRRSFVAPTKRKRRKQNLLELEENSKLTDEEREFKRQQLLQTLAQLEQAEELENPNFWKDNSQFWDSSAQTNFLTWKPANRRGIQGPRWVPVARPVRPKPKFLYGILR